MNKPLFLNYLQVCTHVGTLIFLIIKYLLKLLLILKVSTYYV